MDNYQALEIETCPCRFCDTPTQILGTKLCHTCWELFKRLEDQLQRDFHSSPHQKIVRKMLAAISPGFSLLYVPTLEEMLARDFNYELRIPE